ncbi:hypothetical protein [Oryzihumus sp.]
MTASLEQPKTTFRERMTSLPSASTLSSWRPPSLAAVTAAARTRVPAVAAATRARVPAIAAATRDRMPTAPTREDLARWGSAVASWRPPSWSTVRTTTVALFHIAGVEGFAVERTVVDLWDVHEVTPEYARQLVHNAFARDKADRLVVLNADPVMAGRITDAAAAHGAAYRTTVSLRLVDLLPFG